MYIRRRMRLFRCALVLAPLLASGSLAAQPARSGHLPLREGWALQSSVQVKDPGEVIASDRFDAAGWYPVTVPTTVVAGLVASKVLPDPYFGMNVRNLPGMDYPMGKNFSKYPMGKDSPFAVPWWFRKQFTIPADWKRPGQTTWLHFAGINYRANIWVNGQQLARADDIAGALRTHDFDITAVAKAGGGNVVALEIFAPKENNLAITFVDWNPMPPDKSMGLWREVYLSSSGPVALRHPTVTTDLDPPANDTARLTVTALVQNGAAQPVTARVKGRINKIAFQQDVSLAPGERKDVVFDPATFPALTWKNPALWWPAQMGTPTLHDLTVRVEVAGKLSHQVTTKVGIREITSELDANKKRLFIVNGKKLLVRGAGWSSDMLLTYDPRRIEDQLAYVQHLGLNTIRLEGKLETEHFFDLADRLGILVMAGWCCCDHWEKWDKWGPQDHLVAEQSARSQIYRLRSHPSLLAFLNGSDFPPPPDVERMYLRVEKELLWPNPTISSATAKATPVSGESGVKMSGPYEWIPPDYWMTDKKRGGAHGFNSETSPGPAPPPIESLRRMFPPDKLWPQNEVWGFHAGGDVFTDIKKFTTALEARYGKAQTVEDFAAKSQLMAYEGIRAMFEAYSRNKYVSTGVIQWMLNNAWPGLIWHLYDWYLRPGGGYFGARLALETLHPVYGYDDGAIHVINSSYLDRTGLRLTARVLNLDMTEKFTRTVTLDLPADGVVKALPLPAVASLDLGPTYFVHLVLDDAAGKRVGSNFYWLPTKKDVMDWDKSEWYLTPTRSYADLTALAALPRVNLLVASKTGRPRGQKGGDMVTTVTISNPSPHLAFFVRLKVNKGHGGEEILPVRWEDNYLSLLPGEKRQVTARYRAADLGSSAASVEVSGINVAPVSR
jgi:exo-1,4-beta-D-glucosaminidase